jgi:hypothetical protein
MSKEGKKRIIFLMIMLGFLTLLLSEQVYSVGCTSCQSICDNYYGGTYCDSSTSFCMCYIRQGSCLTQWTSCSEDGYCSGNPPIAGCVEPTTCDVTNSLATSFCGSDRCSGNEIINFFAKFPKQTCLERGGIGKASFLGYGQSGACSDNEIVINVSDCSDRNCTKNITAQTILNQYPYCENQIISFYMTDLYDKNQHLIVENINFAFEVSLGTRQSEDYCQGKSWYTIQNPHYGNCNYANSLCVTNLTGGKFDTFCLHNSTGYYPNKIIVSRGSGSIGQNSIGGFFTRLWNFLTGSVIKK